MICASEFVSICFGYLTTTPQRKDQINHNHYNGIHIIGQENRLMPLYQAFDKYMNFSVEQKESNPGQNQFDIHLTFALPDKLDGTVAYQIINDTKNKRKYSKDQENRIYTGIHEG